MRNLLVVAAVSMLSCGGATSPGNLEDAGAEDAGAEIDAGTDAGVLTKWLCRFRAECTRPDGGVSEVKTTGTETDQQGNRVSLACAADQDAGSTMTSGGSCAVLDETTSYIQTNNPGTTCTPCEVFSCVEQGLCE